MFGRDTEELQEGRRDQAEAAFAAALKVYIALGAAADLARLHATPR